MSVCVSTIPQCIFTFPYSVCEHGCAFKLTISPDRVQYNWLILLIAYYSHTPNWPPVILLESSWIGILGVSDHISTVSWINQMTLTWNIDLPARHFGDSGRWAPPCCPPGFIHCGPGKMRSFGPFVHQFLASSCCPSWGFSSFRQLAFTFLGKCQVVHI